MWENQRSLAQEASLPHLGGKRMLDLLSNKTARNQNSRFGTGFVVRITSNPKNARGAFCRLHHKRESQRCAGVAPGRQVPEYCLSMLLFLTLEPVPVSKVEVWKLQQQLKERDAWQACLALAAIE